MAQHIQYRPGTDIVRLRTTEQLATATFRLWVISARHSAPPASTWYKGLEAAGIAHAAIQPCDALFHILAAARGSELDVRCLCHRRLGLDEARLLALLRLCQGWHWREAREYACEWLPPAAARHVIIPAMDTASAFALGRLHFAITAGESGRAAANEPQRTGHPSHASRLH